MTTLSQKWRQEVSYCATLTINRGSENVGRGSTSVAPYLDCQAAGAKRDNLPALAQRFEVAAAHVRRGNWGWAHSQMIAAS